MQPVRIVESFLTLRFYCGNYDLSIKISPVISGGIGRPIMVRMVGAISASFPGLIVPFQSLSIIKKGTRFNVCAVLGIHLH